MVNNLYGNKRTVWYLDSFEGLPKPTKEDGERSKLLGEGSLKANYEDTKKFIYETLKLPKDNNIIVKGYFKDTIPTLRLNKIAILRIDADYYESYKLVLENFYHRVVPGGYVIFDDYGSWEGAKKAVDEFFKGSVKLKYLTKPPCPAYIKKKEIPLFKLLISLIISLLFLIVIWIKEKNGTHRKTP